MTLGAGLTLMEQVLAELVRIRRHAETQTAIAQLEAGRPLTDDELARLGVKLPIISELPWVRVTGPAAAGEVIRFERIGPNTEINNWGGTAIQVRVFSARTPAPGQPIDALPLSATKRIPAGGGWYLRNSWIGGLLMVTIATDLEIVVE